MTIGWAGWVGITAVTVVLTCLGTVIITTVRDIRRDRAQAIDEARRAAITRRRVQQIHTGAGVDTATLMLPHLQDKDVTRDGPQT